MTDSTSASAHSHPLSVDKAMNECFTACNMTDVHLAHRGLATLLARPRSKAEDDPDIHDSVVALIRFTREATTRRGGLALNALQALSAAIQRERLKRAT